MGMAPAGEVFTAEMAYNRLRANVAPGSQPAWEVFMAAKDEGVHTGLSAVEDRHGRCLRLIELGAVARAAYVAACTDAEERAEEGRHGIVTVTAWSAVAEAVIEVLLDGGLMVHGAADCKAGEPLVVTARWLDGFGVDLVVRPVAGVVAMTEGGTSVPGDPHAPDLGLQSIDGDRSLGQVACDARRARSVEHTDGRAPATLLRPWAELSDFDGSEEGCDE